MYCGLSVKINTCETLHGTRKSWTHFDSVSACVVGKNPNNHNRSSMADNAITRGSIRVLGSLSISVALWNKAVLEPRVSPAFASTYFCIHCNIRFENTSKYVDTLILFSKNLNQRSLTPTWPLTPCLLRSHVWLYPRIIVSKSHDNTSMYVDTVINFANYYIHTHTTYILHTYYILRTEWVIT